MRARVALLAPELERLPPDQAAEALVAKYRRASVEQERFETYKKQREKLAGQMEEARQELAEAEGILDALCQEAECDDPAKLATVEQASQSARDLRKELDLQNDALAVLAAPATVEEFVAEIERADPDQLPVQIENLTAQIIALEEEYKALSDVVAVQNKASPTSTVRPQSTRLSAPRACSLKSPPTSRSTCGCDLPRPSCARRSSDIARRTKGRCSNGPARSSPN